MNWTRPDYVSETDKEVETALDVARRIDLNGFSDDSLGDVDGFGYCAMVRGPLEDHALAEIFRECPNLQTNEAHEISHAAGWVIDADSMGFWNLVLYDSNEALETAWSEISDHYSLWSGPSEEDYVIRFHGDDVEVSEVWHSAVSAGFLDARLLETFTGDAAETDARAWIFERTEREGFWPTIWETSDGEYFGRVETDEKGNRTVRFPS